MQEFLNFIMTVFILLVRAVFHSEIQFDSVLHPVTVTPSGTIFGLYDVTRRGRRFESYRGIRYAEPPVEDLRFQPAKMIDKYETPVNATKDGHVCPQAWNNCCRTPPYRDMDEDCLFINVYTPLKKDRKSLLPVIFFIHQSAFLAKTARSDIFAPNYLLDRDIVLVTFNYRLATLGNTGDEIAPGNNGMKDQVIALHWVQKNIQAFGGDPDKVTISGCSSGSVSVIAHIVSPMSKGLFHRAISISGSPTKIEKMPTDQYAWAVKQAQLLDCPTTNSSAIVYCLKTRPWTDFARTYDKFYVFDRNPIRQWDMVVENDYGQERFLTMDVMEAIRRGNMTHVPIILSQNTAEFFPMAPPIITNSTFLKQMNEEWEKMAPLAFLLPKTNLKKALEVLRKVYLQNRPLYNNRDGLERLGSLYCDASVAFPVHRLANLICRHSVQPVWYFFFTYVGECSYYFSIYTGKPDRAVHQDETLYLFPFPHYCDQIGTRGRDAVMVDRMTAMWYNFARYGDPNPVAPELLGLYWPPMKPESRTYLQVSDNLTLHENLREKRFEVWEQLYPIDYN